MYSCGKTFILYGLSFFYHLKLEKIIFNLKVLSVVIIMADFLYVNEKGTKFMITIRLARGGAKSRPFYNLVVADKRSPRDGRFIEKLGYYNPLAKGKDIPLSFNLERINHWMSMGAQASDSAMRLIKEAQKAAI